MDRLAAKAPMIGFFEQTSMDTAKNKVVVPQSGEEDDDVVMTAPWNIMVASVMAIMVISGKPILILPLVMPIVASLDTTAGTLFNALFEHPYYRAVRDKFAVLSGLAAVRSRLQASDGAFGNERLYYGMADDGVPSFRILCFNHRMQLVESLLRQFYGPALMKGLLGLAAFVNGGMTFSECLLH